MEDQELIVREHFSKISLDDPFFYSLKCDYPGFEQWFVKKSASADSFAYIFRNPTYGDLDGFLYLKLESGIVGDVTPALTASNRLKIGTFKINPHGTRLGERFIKRAFDVALSYNADALYVTVFQKHRPLVELFKRYGFVHVADKCGYQDNELVMERRLDNYVDDVVLDYPRFPVKSGRHFGLSIYPDWHSRLLPDSLLNTESANILQDVSHTNSIHKIYLTSMHGIENLRRGDTLLIYRTKSFGSAYYTSVITSLCVVESVCHIDEFNTADAFVDYCLPYSVFSEVELRTFYNHRKYPWLVQFTYNLALTKRPNRKILIEDVGLSENMYWGFFPITTEQLKRILYLSQDYEKASSLVYPS